MNAPAPARVNSPSRWKGRAVRWDELTARGGTESFTTGDRLDPYWGGMWTQGSSAVWVSEQLARTQAGAGLARIPTGLDRDADDALADLTSSRNLGSTLAALACVDQWRTVSAEQLAALTGWKRLAKPLSRTMASAFACGLVDRGTFASALLPGASRDRATVYRPSRTDAFERALEPLLSYEQKVAVTGGVPWDFRRQYDRHNLLTVELALRVAEWCEVGTVLGEKLSTVELLAGEGLGRTALHDERAADMTIVRTDGMRIAVELTASAGPDFKEKVRRWAHLLADQSLAASGLTVLFVEAAPADGEHRFGSGASVRSSVYKAVAEVVREFPGTGADRVADRIGVVSWAQWFPGHGFATDEFTRLEVDRPTGPASDRWHRAALLDEIDVPFSSHDPGVMTAVIDNASMLLGTPHWLRERDRAPHLWPLLAQRAGWSGLPVPPPARPSRVVGIYPDATVGVVGATRAPRRMRTDDADPRPSAFTARAERSPVSGVVVRGSVRDVW